MAKYNEGDRVLIHQDPKHPLNDRHRILHGAKATVRVVLNGNRSGEYVVEAEGGLFHIKETNLIPDKSEVLKPYYQMVAYDNDINQVSDSEPLNHPPTKEQVLQYIKLTGASFVDIRKLYGIVGN